MPWDEGAAPNGFTTGTPWLPIKPAQAALNVAGQNADPASTLAFYRTILAWRKAHPVLRTGDIAFYDTAEPVLAYRRSTADTAMVCVFNLSSEPRIVAVGGLDGAGTEPVSHHAELSAQHLQLGPNGYAFIAVPVESKASLDYRGS